MSRTGADAGFATQLPDPGHLWVRYAPRQWRGPRRPWTDCARGTLCGAAGRRALSLPLPEPPAHPCDDVVYLPPVEESERAERDRLARAVVGQGAPVVVQIGAGDAWPAGAASSDAAAPVVMLVDLLDPLLRRDLSALGSLPPPAVALWPLIAGVTDDAALVRRGLEQLAGAGVRHVQALTPELGPADRRWLAAEGDEHRFERLFHAPPPAERDFSIEAHSFGFGPFLERPALPSPPAPSWLVSNRRLGAVLAETAELWLRIGRPVHRGQAYYRSMRYVDRSRHDLAALHREGNLGVLEWLDGESRALIEEALVVGCPALLDELRAHYVARRGAAA